MSPKLQRFLLVAAIAFLVAIAFSSNLYASSLQRYLSPAELSPTSLPLPQISSTDFTVSKGVVYANGQPIVLKGINWFGFETHDHVGHGLWARNWKEMIGQMKSLGFNAVRLPFCPDTLDGVPVTSIDYTLNPDLADLSSRQILNKVAAELNRQKLYFLLDNHSYNCGDYSELWYTKDFSEQQWIASLTKAASAYRNLPYFIGIDLKNEPHDRATWGTGNIETDWNLAAERGGKAVLAANPNILVFVEGIADSRQACSPLSENWWGGNLQPYRCKPINTSAIPANKLVLTPHVYGPDLADLNYFNVSSFPRNLPTVWDARFGYLAKEGLTVIPAEWGGNYGLNNPADRIVQDTLAAYFVDNSICSSFFWAWNPNSHDVGGILEDDWNTPVAAKMNLLTHYYGSCHQ